MAGGGLTTLLYCEFLLPNDTCFVSDILLILHTCLLETYRIR